MVNKNAISAMISSLFMAGSVHAAVSTPTPLVVGHKPTLSFHGTKPTIIQLGDTITVNEMDFTFADIDGDIEATRNYFWKIDEVATVSTSPTFSMLLSDHDLVGKRLTLEITPQTTSGDPRVGDVLIVDYGIVVFNTSAIPSISNLVMSGLLQLGQVIEATYLFESHGGDNRDKSTYQWGSLGKTAAGVSTGMAVTNSQVVDGYQLTLDDVGKVLELTVEAKNGAGMVGNKITIDSKKLTGGGSGGEVVDPTAANVKVDFINPANNEGVHGLGSFGRPVVGISEMTASCKFEGAPVSDYTRCDTAIYKLLWSSTADNGVTYNSITEGVNGALYIPHVSHQGLAIIAEATVK
ncbi:MAG: hypothetical protein ACRC9O_13015 [Plesiomonas sp.]|uniref:hypothetical protein n=1 Tax=Plesiomonas sp. TaxID=2486279 RepID=UPI003F40D60E